MWGEGLVYSENGRLHLSSTNKGCRGVGGFILWKETKSRALDTSEIKSQKKKRGKKDIDMI